MTRSPLRIAVLPERYGQVLSPCASIRLYAPLQALHDGGDATVRWLIEAELERFAPDVVIWHRVGVRDVARIERMHAWATRTGTQLVYDIDDHLLGMDEHPEREAYLPMIAAVRASLAAADRVWCSTQTLAELVEPACGGTVAVMPNVLDPDLWNIAGRGPHARAEGAPLRLFYMGTRTHDEDFAFLCEVMDTLDARRPGRFELHLVGVRTDEAMTAPWLHARPIPGHVGASYFAFVHWLVRQRGFDLGVAPLLATAFNAGKSPIKVLDYAAMGLPALASAVPAYAGLRTGIDCLHAANDVQAWCQALEWVDAHPEQTSALARRAGALVDPDVFAQGCQRRLDDIAGLVARRPVS